MSEMTRFDPAPSRLKYRVERMMLTPLYRLLLRVGLPFALTFGAASWWLSHEENREWIALTYADARAAIQERPEFMVELMAIDGADPAISEDIREIIPLDFPISSFDLDLDAMRRTITGLDAVESASLFVRQGGVLQVNVRKREPVVLWRTEAGLELLDRGGVMTGPVSTRAAFPDLPVIAGSGADAHVNEALRLVAAAAPCGTGCAGWSGWASGAGTSCWIAVSASCCPKRARCARWSAPSPWIRRSTCWRATSSRSTFG